jgi:phage gp46-like protein
MALFHNRERQGEGAFWTDRFNNVMPHSNFYTLRLDACVTQV